MKRLDISNPDTKEFFINALKNEELIPILGAGFSCGMKARKDNKVPSGTQLKSYMIDSLIRQRTDFKKESLEKQTFSWISERFLKLDIENICNYFYNSFTNIKFSGVNKEKFLNYINWPYIYTLNIDTAIENSNDNWEVFYPNSNFIDKSVFNKNKLYKIHGDINHFLKTKNIDDLILSERQYLLSLNTNSVFHEKLMTDCIGKNLLYIGCSLDDEIDIKFSIITDMNKNKNAQSTYRIYVTTEDIELDSIKKENLESFQITHYIKLNSVDEYELFYEYILECYEESLKYKSSSLDKYEIITMSQLDDSREKNLEFLYNSLISHKLIKPYYYIIRDEFEKLKLANDKINIFLGRRFSGKTMYAVNIIDYYKDRKRYFVLSDDSISDTNLVSLINQKNSLIIIDSNSINEEQFNLVCREFSNRDEFNTSIICIFVNTFDEIINSISYYSELLDVKDTVAGLISENDNKKINKKLNDIGLLSFDPKQTILDNTLRIANILNGKYLDPYTIGSKSELILLIWIAVHKKMYLEEIIALGLIDSYNYTVKKFAPILQIERTYKGEKYEHSSIKILCNASLSLLQILNNYAYPMESEIGRLIKEKRFKTICEAIYEILLRYEKTDEAKTRKFLMFDTLNDIFSRRYSKVNISKLLDDKGGKPLYGAASLIQNIYEDKNIQKLKSGEPNYWLQRAKSIYILNSGSKGSITSLEKGIEWAKIAEGDSETKINNGINKYLRTFSNAIIQIAMIYGKIAYKKYYKDKYINTCAISYYYKGLSDENNLQAAKSLIDNSRGTKDFVNLLNHIKVDKSCIYDDAIEKSEYLCNLRDFSNGIVYRF